ncbi:MAG: AI-2E family transporter [Bacteroidota bacterium]
MRTQSIQHGAFLTLVVLVTLAFFGLLVGFLQPIFWAAVLAVLFYPLQWRLARAFGGRSGIAALLTLLVILLSVILPLFAIGAAVTNEAVGLYNRLDAGEFDLQEPIRRFEEALPVVTGYLDQLGVDFERVKAGLSDAALTVSQATANRAVELGQGTVTFAVLFALMLYLLFFFLRDADRLTEGLIRALPLGDDRERRLFRKFADVSRATIKGTVVVGIVQGAIGGVLFWALGLPAPVLWGVVMALASLLPAVGPALVWVPAAILLAAAGNYVDAGIVVGVGVFIIGMADNVLRPILVGRDTQMPDYLILLSTLGGLAVFGLSGVVIGPVIAALFLSVWEMFVEEYGDADDVQDPPSTSPPAASEPPGPSSDPPSSDPPSSGGPPPAQPPSEPTPTTSPATAVPRATSSPSRAALAQRVQPPSPYAPVAVPSPGQTRGTTLPFTATPAELPPPRPRPDSAVIRPVPLSDPPRPAAPRPTASPSRRVPPAS